MRWTSPSSSACRCTPRASRGQSGANLSVSSIFPFGLARIAQREERQTPLVIPDSTHAEVRLEVVLPENARMPVSLPTFDKTEKRSGAHVIVKDTVFGHAIHLDRQIDIPAGRIEPGEAYAAYAQFIHEAHAALAREVLVAPP